jgi:hypothetical protein
VSYVYKEPEPQGCGNGHLPDFALKALEQWPQSGSGDRLVHRHVLKVVNLLRHYVGAEAAGELVRGRMPRRAKPGEIEGALGLAYGTGATPRLDRPPPHLASVTYIEQIVAERFSGGSMLEELQNRSPSPIPNTTDEIVHALFEPDSLICVGWRPEEVLTAPLANLEGLEAWPHIVPSPMSDLYSVDAKGEKHKRSLANTGARRYLVTDFDIKPLKTDGSPSIYAGLIERWEAHGVTIQDAAAALIAFLTELPGPLVMVVYSGNISLQAWWFAEGEDESMDAKMRGFFTSAVILGADRQGWSRCQLFRMPGSLRKDTGRRQTVHYFDRSKIK